VRLSGTHANAVAAAKRFDPDNGRVTMVDSRTASLGQSLLVVRGVELAAAKWRPDGSVRELERVRAQSGGFFTVPLMSLTIEGRVRSWGIFYQSEDGTKAEAARYD
jgi:fatty acid-binding protein DegV